MTDKTEQPPIETKKCDEVQKPESEQSSLPAGLSKIGDELIGSMPDVSQHTIDRHEQVQSANNATLERATEMAQGRKDRNGQSFDPALHKWDESTGDVTLTKAGKLSMKSGRGRPPGKTRPTPQSKISTPDGNVSSMPVVSDTAKARATGIAAANSLIMLGVVMGGDEWQPKVVKHDGAVVADEKHNLEEAFGQYFEVTGRTDFPPGIALSIAVIGYAAPRFTMPVTKSKTKNLYLRFRDWRAARKAKKEHAKGIKQQEREAAAAKQEETSAVNPNVVPLDNETV